MTREEVAVYYKQYYEKNREKKLAYQKQYREQNLEKIVARQKQYRERNREKIAARQKQYQERNREKIAARVRVRADFISRWKIAAGCFDCGWSRALALDFDHVRGTKRRNVSVMVAGKIGLLLKEIDKCVVRCANCHREETVLRKILA